MDVKCEKCGTEYELDESRLKPGGVTVKCTNCGHLFRVRKLEGAVPHPVTPGSSVPPAQRTWLIRLEDGEIRTTSELATLQQWIAAGLVNRNCEISRTGKTWKPLGDINELSSFFRVADEARGHSRRIQAIGSIPPASSAPGPIAQPTESSLIDTGAKPAGAKPAPGSTLPMGAPTAASAPAASPSVAPPAAAPRRPSVAPPPAAAAAPSQAVAADPSFAGKPSAERSGEWASPAAPRLAEGQRGPSGPTGGFRKAAATGEAAFVGGDGRQKRPSFVEPEDERAPFDDPAAEISGEFDLPAGTGAGKWIVVASLVVIAFAVAALYLFVFRGDGEAPELSGITTAGDGQTPVDTASVDDPAADGNAEMVARALEAVRIEDTAALAAAAEALRPIVAQTDSMPAGADAALSRVLAAQAQHVLDQAAAGTGDSAALRDDARKLTREAQKLAAAALERDRTSPAANVARADVLRLLGRRASEVDGVLKPVLTANQREVDALYVQALLRERDDRLADARRLFGQVARLGDVRGRYRLGLAALADGDLATARAEIQAVLSASPGHEGAQRAMTRIESRSVVVQSDPLPPEVIEPTGTGAAANAAPDDGDNDGKTEPAQPRDYDGLLERADRLSENGDCKRAMDLYNDALDINPGGVAALTGLGYCHVEFRQFASAHAKFRAALGISPRYQDALIGVAEAYRFQGLTDQAVQAYRRYLSHHPGGSKATMATRQIEMLGGGASGAGPEPDEGGDSSAADPTDPANEPGNDAPGGEPVQPDEPAPADDVEPAVEAPTVPDKVETSIDE